MLFDGCIQLRLILLRSDARVRFFSTIFLMVSVWQPIASIVTIPPETSIKSSIFGIAVISLPPKD